MEKIKVECSDCGGTGLYSGMCEGPDEAVVCLGCSGSGCQELTGKKFTGRKRKRGIKRVRVSAGRFIVSGVGGRGATMTYQEFLDKFPER